MPDAVLGYYGLDAGREDGRWRVRVYPIIDEDEDGDFVSGEDVVTLEDQTHCPDPLLLLRALLTGLQPSSEAYVRTAKVGLRLALENAS